jgi:hypothetical protein
VIAPADVLASIKSASQIVRSAVDSDLVRDGLRQDDDRRVGDIGQGSKGTAYVRTRPAPAGLRTVSTPLRSAMTAYRFEKSPPNSIVRDYNAISRHPDSCR